ncbi:MAG: hypothetical protein K2K68_01640, partial [Duncaniella sp.]|nr:hypothetical protein [Duncaniella sp.]
MKKTYLYGAVAMGLLFTGCSADDLQGPAGDGVSESDQAYYVSMSISGDGAQSRAVGAVWYTHLRAHPAQAGGVLRG